MKKYNAFLYICLTGLCLTFMGCPKPSDDDSHLAAAFCQHNTNYVYANGECTCPEGFFELGNEMTDYSCLPKTEGSFLMTSSGCFCGSEMVFQMNVSEGNTSEYRDFTLFYNGNDHLSFPTSCQYTKREDGDEIFINNTGDVKCLDGVWYSIEMRGKFNPERTQMNAEVIFFEIVDRTFIRKDTCTFLLSK